MAMFKRRDTELIPTIHIGVVCRGNRFIGLNLGYTKNRLSMFDPKHTFGGSPSSEVIMQGLCPGVRESEATLV